uniref:Thiolase N-terminal domain-containing protein n=1 Tax=Archaeoglobus fulgidus TaxID=2234 RepID=A0A7C3VBJ4_ARCFL
MRVAVVGFGQTPFKTKRRDKTHPEIVFEAINSALEHAGLELKDIEAVVYGCMDPFDGIYCPERWDSTACGLEKPIMKISTGGTTGMTTASGSSRACGKRAVRSCYGSVRSEGWRVR